MCECIGTDSACSMLHPAVQFYVSLLVKELVWLWSDRPWSMQAIHESVDGRHVICPEWAPVVKARGVGYAVCEAMCNREATTTIQLCQHDNHLAR